jgi:transcription elongation factor GreA
MRTPSVDQVVGPLCNCLALVRDLQYGRDSARLQRPGAPLFCICVLSAGPAMIEELKQKLGDEVQRLQHELNVVLPNEIRKAVELGDLRENSEYKAALERQQFVQARLGQLRQRLSKLSQIDLAQIPNDKVGLGSRVVVEDQATKAHETYSLVFGDSVEFEEGHVSMGSVIGRALVGKAVGDDVLLKLPALTRRFKIVELTTIHQGASLK